MRRPIANDRPDSPAHREASDDASARAKAIKSAVVGLARDRAGDDGRTRTQGAISQIVAVELGLRLTRELLTEEPLSADFCNELTSVLDDLTYRIQNAGDLLASQALYLRPEDGFLLARRALRCLDHGDPSEAAERLRWSSERLLESSDSQKQYLAGYLLGHLARVLRDQGNEEQARAEFQRAAEQIQCLRAHGFSEESLEQLLRLLDPERVAIGE